jgi:tRNA-Thr(GGU) m(6)t(6)A37 methyltransferase TsaA
MELKPIGVIHSPYMEKKDAPRQGRLSDNEIKLEIYPEFTDGLQNIEQVSHLIVLYWGHHADRSVLQTVTPFSPEVTGVFACRSPNRPNPLAFCIADLIRRDGNVLTVRGVDALDGSALLDIKAYSGTLDSIPEAVIGWQRARKNGEKADG